VVIKINRTMPGKLYLIPSALGDGPLEKVIPAYNYEVIRSLSWFVVEEIRTARRFLRKIDREIDIDRLNFVLLNEHTPAGEVEGILEPLVEGHDLGLLSEAGLPCIADPGAQLVLLAQRRKIKVIPLTGPSSIFLALMASGFNGQNFAFHGYLPVDKKARAQKIREMETDIQRKSQTQIFIEAPYRNQQVFRALVENCSTQTALCIAADITLDTEYIVTKSMVEWKKEMPCIDKRPAVFLLYK
jgi:16S rRNA (cytidine1402-2'-O)-methyltransferase